mmetsp:Transcript_123837/g.174626  ORF Transcript_123837/g.174626 Transcript_123837/m.174626 type:complete len:215 (-) Transcript_123837:338-982(-)
MMCLAVHGVFQIIHTCVITPHCRSDGHQQVFGFLGFVHAHLGLPKLVFGFAILCLRCCGSGRGGVQLGPQFAQLLLCLFHCTSGICLLLLRDLLELSFLSGLKIQIFDLIKSCVLRLGHLIKFLLQGLDLTFEVMKNLTHALFLPRNILLQCCKVVLEFVVVFKGLCMVFACFVMGCTGILHFLQCSSCCTFLFSNLGGLVLDGLDSCQLLLDH